jgi:hypothetical protein
MLTYVFDTSFGNFLLRNAHNFVVYSDHPNTRLVQIWNGLFVSGSQMVS